jgi:hypothetical protein
MLGVWDINFPKPSRIEFVHEPAPLLVKSDTHASAPQLLEYIYRTAHRFQFWLPTKLAEWLCGMRVSAVQRCDDSDECKDAILFFSCHLLPKEG